MLGFFSSFGAPTPLNRGHPGSRLPLQVDAVHLRFDDTIRSLPIRGRIEPPKAFGHAVMEGTMAQNKAGRSQAERGVGMVVLIIVTL